MAKEYNAELGKLRNHLALLLDLEMDCPAENVNIEKVNRILELTELCSDSVDTGDMEAFAERFNRRYRTSIKPLRQKRRNLTSRLLKLAACFVLFAVLFGATEFVAVNAFHVSIVETMSRWGNSIQKYVDKIGGDDRAVEESLKSSEGGRIILPQTEIDMAKDFYRIAGYEEKEAEKLALQYVKEINALYQEAIANGFTVSDQEVREYLKEQKKLYQEADNKEELYAYMERFDSEQAYWEFQFEVYKKDLPIQKYNAACERKFMEEQAEDGSADGLEIQDQWAEEFERRKAEAVEKYDFVMDYPSLYERLIDSLK